MSSYRLASIPKFDKQHKAIAKAAKAREWQNLIVEFDKLPTSEQACVLGKVSELIFVEGLLIVRFPDEEAENRRNAFKRWLATKSSSLLDKTGQVNVERGIKQSEAVESLFRDAYKRCCDLADGQDPISLVWASIRLAHQEYLDWRSQAMSAAQANPSGDRISDTLSTAPDGFEATFTDITFKIDAVLQRELRFFAVQNDWMEGTLKIPGHMKEAPLLTAQNRRNAVAILDRVEDTDNRSRLYGGGVVSLNVDLPEMKGKLTTGVFPVDWQIALTVAGERLQRRIDQLYDRFWNKDSDASGQASPLEDLLAKSEELEHFVFSELTGKPVESDGEAFAELTAWEWIRGYLVLRFLAQQYLHHAENLLDPHRLGRACVLDVLAEAGLKTSSSELFIELCSFNRKSVDLHDCPIIPVGNDDLCLLPFPANTQCVTRLVLSQLSKREVRFDDKGIVLEERLNRLLSSHSIQCGDFHRTGRNELEIDQIVLWEQTLFVFECKFYSLPSENARHQFDFCTYQVDAAEQLLKKVKAIEKDRSIVEKALGVGSDTEWSSIVPVVLNGMPFSLPGMVNGVYYADYSSVERFFESGKLHPLKADSKETPDFSDSEKPIDLWAGTKPAVSELKRMLEVNPHFQRLAAKWAIRAVKVEVAAGHYFCTNLLGPNVSDADAAQSSFGKS
jgi:hypothetical protein